MMSCVKCRKIYYVEKLEDRDTWKITEYDKTYYREPSPIRYDQLVELIQTGNFTLDYDIVYNNRAFIVAADKPICPQLGCGEDLENVYLMRIN